jgi:hypothetical protein
MAYHNGFRCIRSSNGSGWGNVFSAKPATNAKVSPAAVQSFAPKAGIGFRRIGQSTTITGTDAVFGITLNYDEKLNTNYSGAYLGLTASQPLDAGFVVSLDGEAGLYWAHTAYDGSMLTNRVSAGNSSLSLSKDNAAFVGAIKAAIDKDLGNNWKVGVFARAEWYSYAPEMNYNTFDRTGTVTAFSGPNNGNIDRKQHGVDLVGRRAPFVQTELKALLIRIGPSNGPKLDEGPGAIPGLLLFGWRENENDHK